MLVLVMLALVGAVIFETIASRLERPMLGVRQPMPRSPSPYREAVIREPSRPRPTSMWRLLEAFTVPWELRRRRKRFGNARELARFRDAVEFYAACTRDPKALDRGASADNALRCAAVVRKLYVSRTRPWRARGTRPRHVPRKHALGFD